MTVALAALVLAAIGAPHRIRLESAPPALAAFVWLAALGLRAMTAVFAAMFLGLFLPTTELFVRVTEWCWHAGVPLIGAHLPLHGHVVGHIALLTPALGLLASALWAVIGLWRAARGVRLLLRRAVVGRGPRDSLLLADGDILVAAAGVRRPRVVVSAGAMLAFDDDELYASLDHEHGHIARHHRHILILGELFRALARFLPGTRAAIGELLFYVERDADRYAIARRHDPAVLASAICKAARGSPLGAPALALGGGLVTRRIRLLLDGEVPSRSPRRLPVQALALLMTALLVLTASAVLPSTVRAGSGIAGIVVRAHHCAAHDLAELRRPESRDEPGHVRVRADARRKHARAAPGTSGWGYPHHPDAGPPHGANGPVARSFASFPHAIPESASSSQRHMSALRPDAAAAFLLLPAVA